MYQYDDDPLSILTYEELFEELDAEMIRGAAVDYLGGENRVQVLLMPEAAEERDDSAGEEAAEPAAAREAA